MPNELGKNEKCTQLSEPGTRCQVVGKITQSFLCPLCPSPSLHHLQCILPLSPFSLTNNKESQKQRDTLLQRAWAAVWVPASMAWCPQQQQLSGLCWELPQINSEPSSLRYRAWYKGENLFHWQPVVSQPAPRALYLFHPKNKHTEVCNPTLETGPDTPDSFLLY